MKSGMNNFARLKNAKNVFMILLSVIVLGLVSGFIVFETTKASVTLVLDGEKKPVETHADTVEELLQEEQIKPTTHDYVSHDLKAELTSGEVIEWKPAVQVTLTINGENKKVWTTRNTVDELLEDENVKVSEHDQLSASRDDKLKEDMNITVDEAFQMTVNDGGKQTNVWTTSTTVAGFLEQQNIQLGELDRVEPEKDSNVKENSEIKVIRVEKVTDVVEESIDYATVTKEDRSMQQGKEKVLEAGSEGKQEKHYEVVLENGKEVSRELKKTEVVKQKSDRIVYVGTQVITQLAEKKSSNAPAKTKKSTASKSSSAPKSKSNASTSGGKVLNVSTTAYTANCTGCSGITSTGYNLKTNPNAKVIAVDPSVIPLGSKVHVEGYGTAIAADTGGAIKGNKIDVFFSSKSAAYAWGNKTVKITILN
ncbi:ubiquitin-like domain-containing protein [Alkalihalobacillus macyae]|uniref:G5 and 3D domain-containing protein n=1 Tax=Guptibacillus hwajinpoensis TaxID=208199 RepID=UPI00273B087A|nr:G5 and 3D domain-containing protein [Alkalihalobacillus macyae]MDP4553384.1 ubiquitin-like domain-containing protein [Alkalihalobacillus macyae]